MTKWLKKPSVQRGVYGALLLLWVVVLLLTWRYDDCYRDSNIWIRDHPIYVQFMTVWILGCIILVWQIILNNLIGWSVMALLYLYYVITCVINITGIDSERLDSAHFY